MSKKILAICAALVAFGAFAVMPAIGSAATLKDTSGGVVTNVAVGSKIIGEGTGTTVLTGGLTVECNENVFTGTVHRNSGGIVEGTIEDAWFQSNFNASGTNCRSGSSEAVVKTNLTNSTVGTARHWCLKTIEGTDNWELVGNNCTGSSPELTFSITVGSLTCGYKRTAAITGSFTTDSGTHAATRLTMAGEPEFSTDAVPGHSILCPSTGKLKNFVFDLYTDTNTTTTPHPYPVNTTDPIFVGP